MTAARSVVVVLCVVAAMAVAAPASTVAAPASVVTPSADGTGGAAAALVAGARTPPTLSRTDATCPHTNELHFGRQRYVEQRGDVARITLLFDDDFSDDSLALYVRGDENEFDSHVEVRDGNGDGRVTVLFDTAVAGSGRPAETFRTAAAADEVLDREASALDGPLPTGVYDLTVWGPGCAQDYADLVVEDSGPVALTAYRGDRSLLADLNSSRAVREALAHGDLRKTHGREHLAERTGVTDSEDQPFREGAPVLRGETLALALEAPALADDLADAADPVARFRAMLGREVTVEAVESGPSHGVDEPPPERYDLSAFGDWQVYPDTGNDTVYLLLDTRGPYAPAENATDYGLVGERYVVTATVGDGATGTTAFEFATPAAELDLSGVLEEVLVSATADGRVTGSASLPDGTTLTVALRSDRASVSTSREVAVEDGRFVAGFDLSDVESGTQFEAVVTHGGVELDRRDGRVRASATVRFPEYDASFERSPDTVRLDRAVVTDGGFVVVHRESADGPVVGTSAYLSPGEHTDVAVPLDETIGGTSPGDGTTLVAVARHDSDGDGQFDPEADQVYRRGTPEDVVHVLVVTPTATAGGTPASPATADAPPTTTVAPTDARTSSHPGTPDSGPIPGFGPLAALGGVAAALVVARATSSTGSN